MEAGERQGDGDERASAVTAPALPLPAPPSLARRALPRGGSLTRPGGSLASFLVLLLPRALRSSLSSGTARTPRFSRGGERGGRQSGVCDRQAQGARGCGLRACRVDSGLAACSPDFARPALSARSGRAAENSTGLDTFLPSTRTFLPPSPPHPTPPPGRLVH